MHWKWSAEVLLRIRNRKGICPEPFQWTCLRRYAVVSLLERGPFDIRNGTIESNMVRNRELRCLDATVMRKESRVWYTNKN